jgi:hypothetical protein
MVSYLTITDPRHGLAGQRVEFVSHRSGRGPAYVVVRLPDGRCRSVRRSATDLVTASPEHDASNSTARISVKTLLTLMRHLDSKVSRGIEEVIRDEHPVESVPRGVQNPHPTFKAGQNWTTASLARLAGRDAKADRAELRPPTPADATDPRADDGGPA